MRRKISIFIGAVFCLMLISQGLYADDTEIFGGAEINVPPNVLLIMDNSGSMAEYVDVIVDAYDPSTTYSGSYDISKVYYKWTWWWFSGWSDFTDIGSDGVVDSSEIDCESARDGLNDEGNWSGYIRNYGSFSCGGDYYLLRTGNYMNYRETTGATSRKKIDIAKDVLTELIDDTKYSSVRFGLMIFNNSEGGRIISPVGSPRANIKTQINGVSAQTWTPLAETLAEAGLYFARQPSWCNPTGSTTKINYNTYDLNGDGSVNFDDWPVQFRCQKSYVILMTDGASTEDRGSVLTRSDYMHGDPIKDYDGDNHEPGYSDSIYYSSNGSDYLDDVAGFLYDNDLLLANMYDSSGISFDSPDFKKQNIVTYTIGFAINHDLLEDAAANGHGKYFTTEATGGTGLSLEEIFAAIMGEILADNAEFVAPVVPVNRVNRTYADNAMYLGLFSPDTSGLWKGNIKKFGLKAAKDSNGDYYLMILDRQGNDATDGYGNIREDALSCWNPSASLAKEGLSVDQGGAGLTIKTATRSFKTYKVGTGMLNFNSTNITAADLDLSTDAQRDDLINYVTASGIYAATSEDNKRREWIMGDIVHSKPAILYDRTNNRNVMFVGANDGFLHCFVDSDMGTSDNLEDDVVEEKWAFIPWELIPKLKTLPPENATYEIAGDINHDWFVDGSPVVYENSSSTYLIFGLRRGGDGYYCLNVDDYTAPTWQWAIASNILGGETLGQSWSTPRVCKILATGGTTYNNVILLTGGYDTNQDNADPGTGDSKGRGVFAVDAGNGALISNLKFYNGDGGFGSGYMNYCIVELMSYDDNGDDCDDVIYAGDMGGSLFVFNDKNSDGAWVERRLFDAGNDGGTSYLRKFSKAPGIVQETWGDYVYIGSGDREHPLDTETLNRFYAIKNTWPDTGDYSNGSPITTSDLVDVTQDYLQGSSTVTAYTGTQYENHLAAILDNGWYIDLEEINGSEVGEKVVSTPLIYGGVVYFTTFIPSSISTAGQDPCTTSIGAGTARLWAVDYKTGNAVFKSFDGNSSTLTREDRFKNIGGGIPSDPVLVVTPEGTFIGVGTQGSPKFDNTGENTSIERFFWMK